MGAVFTFECSSSMFTTRLRELWGRRLATASCRIRLLDFPTIFKLKHKTAMQWKELFLQLYPCFTYRRVDNCRISHYVLRMSAPDKTEVIVAKYPVKVNILREHSPFPLEAGTIWHKHRRNNKNPGPGHKKSMTLALRAKDADCNNGRATQDAAFRFLKENSSIRSL